MTEVGWICYFTFRFVGLHNQVSSLVWVDLILFGSVYADRFLAWTFVFPSFLHVCFPFIHMPATPICQLLQSVLQCDREQTMLHDISLYFFVFLCLHSSSLEFGSMKLWVKGINFAEIIQQYSSVQAEPCHDPATSARVLISKGHKLYLLGQWCTPDMGTDR